MKRKILNTLVNLTATVGGFFCFKTFEEYLKTEYFDLHSYLRFGRLPVHEMLKVKCLTYGESLGFKVKAEYKVGSKRIDVVWLNNEKVEVAIEIDEGLNYRAIKKMSDCGAKNKVCVFFDVKKMSQREIEGFIFNEIYNINLSPRGN